MSEQRGLLFSPKVSHAMNWPGLIGCNDERNLNELQAPIRRWLHFLLFATSRISLLIAHPTNYLRFNEFHVKTSPKEWFFYSVHRATTKLDSNPSKCPGNQSRASQYRSLVLCVYMSAAMRICSQHIRFKRAHFTSRA